MKRIVLIFFLLVATLATHAQVREFQIGAQQNSITRSVDENCQLIYTQPTVDSGFFILYRAGDPTAQAFRVPPKWEIHDVRIHNGADAYFCGTDGNKGVFGMFNIATVFAGTGSVNYVVCPESTQELSQPTDLKRLDLYEVGGLVNMAMVGTSIWGKLYQNTTLVSAYRFGANWYLDYYPNKERWVAFTDVACLDNVIVAVGSDTNGVGCYLKTFRLMPNFPQYPMVMDSLVQVEYEKPVGDVLATHMSGNQVLLAQFNEGKSGPGTVLHKVGISPLTGRPTTATFDTWRSVPPATLPFGTTWRMMELNWDGNGVWLLQRAQYATAVVATLADWLLNMPLTATTATADAWLPMMCIAQSMDVVPALGQPWLSGTTRRLTTYDPAWHALAECRKHDRIDFDQGVAPWRAIRYGDTEEFMWPNDYVHPVGIKTIQVEIKCE